MDMKAFFEKFEAIVKALYTYLADVFKYFGYVAE